MNTYAYVYAYVSVYKVYTYINPQTHMYTQILASKTHTHTHRVTDFHRFSVKRFNSQGTGQPVAIIEINCSRCHAVGLILKLRVCKANSLSTQHHFQHLVFLFTTAINCNELKYLGSLQ